MPPAWNGRRHRRRPRAISTQCPRSPAARTAIASSNRRPLKRRQARWLEMAEEVMPQAAAAPQFHDAEQRRQSAELGMWVFLASEVMFFGVPFAAYGVSRFNFGEAFAAAGRHTDIVLGTLNTALLLTSSYTI